MILTIVFCVLLIIAKSDEIMVLFALLMVLDTVTIILFAAKINKKRKEYLQLLQEERNAIVRKGLFKEVYDAYKHDGFEFNLIYDKLVKQSVYSNNWLSFFIRFRFFQSLMTPGRPISAMAKLRRPM